MQLINRYDIEKLIDKKQAHSLVTTIQRDLSSDKHKVMYVESYNKHGRYEQRSQVKHYNI